MSLLLLGAAVLCRWQDPQPVAQDPVKQDPASKQVAAKQEPAKQNPAEKPTDKQAQKKVPGKPDRSPLEGVYRLRKRVTNGIPDAKPNKGYLAITSRHLFLSLASAGLDETLPLLHSGVREWIKVGADVRTTAKLDYYTDGDGVIHQTPEGKQEVRRIELVLGGVRVMQGPHSWLEFERVE
tara:strand:- start:20555 stop:21097 length:543 start_codon:yes stop_codon:yes gene_type:complete